MADLRLIPSPAPRLCRDCFRVDRVEARRSGDAGAAHGRCVACGSLRLVSHPELLALTIGHVDCDAFYASVEKQRRPELAGKPVVVGGGERGVVTAACYVARLSGVRSAMPMFRARALCPDAVVIRPDFPAYAAASRAVRALMRALTPAVQFLSVDEAVLDLAGTEALHGAPPAAMLARLALDVEQTLGITVSVGLAPNRLLSKLAAGRDKPRGFSVLGADAAAWLAGKPVRLLPGIGPAQEKRLLARGYTTLGQLAALDARTALERLGDDGPGLAARARGEDGRRVVPGGATKSISAETTFSSDLADAAGLERELWRMCERLAARLRDKGVAAGGVVLKLRTRHFALRTRSRALPAPTVLPDTLFAAARPLLARELDGTFFRLIGIGAASLAEPTDADRDDLADHDRSRGAARQRAIDALRERYGAGAVVRGRALSER